MLVIAQEPNLYTLCGFFLQDYLQLETSMLKQYKHDILTIFFQKMNIETGRAKKKIKNHNEKN